MKNSAIVSKIFLLLILLCCSTSFVLADTLKFVQLSDTHISDVNKTKKRLLYYSDELLEDAIKQINSEEGVEFTFLTGDAINEPTEKLLQRFIGCMDELNMPWYAALGNHDTTANLTLSKEYFIKSANKYIDVDRPYYAFSPKDGFHIIVLDATIPCTSVGEIPECQLCWLAEQIDSVPRDDVIMIFIHHPIFEPYNEKKHRIINTKEIENLLNSCDRPIAIFSGHYHVAKITKKKKLLQVTSPSLISYPFAFRIVEVQNLPDKIVYEFCLVQTQLPDVREQAEAFKLNPFFNCKRDSDRRIEIKK